MPFPHHRDGCCHILLLWRWTLDTETVWFTWITSGDRYTQIIVYLVVWKLPVISLPGHFQANSSLWHSCEGGDKTISGWICGEPYNWIIQGSRGWCLIARNSPYKFVGHSYELYKKYSLSFFIFLCFSGHGKCKWSVIYPTPLHGPAINCVVAFKWRCNAV